MLILDVAADIAETTAAAVTEAAAALPFDFYDKIKIEDSTIIGRILTGLQVTVIGMAVVFAVLMLLWGILELFGVIVASMTKEKKANEVNEPMAEIPEPVVEESETVEDNGALIAVLTAAIIEYNKGNESDISDGEENKGFRIVSFKERSKII